MSEGGDYAYFQIGVIDSYDNIIYAPVYSDYVKVNYQPNRPTLIVPAKNNVSTYNAACPVWLQSGTDGDGYNQDYGVGYGSQASMWGSYRQIFKFQGIEDEAITIDSCNTESSPLAINITKLTIAVERHSCRLVMPLRLKISPDLRTVGGSYCRFIMACLFSMDRQHYYTRTDGCESFAYY